MRALVCFIVAITLALHAPFGHAKSSHERVLLQSTASSNASAIAIENRANLTSSTPSSATSNAQAVSVVSQPTTQQCVTLLNTNYQGEVIEFVSNVSSAAQCCSLCSSSPFGCNVYVYCPLEQNIGCDDGSGRIYPGKLCTLKYQRLAAGVAPTAYGSGPSVSWTSGIVSTSNLGQCVAEASASAAASASCNSIAYAVAVARAEDACGASASASALAVAVGGKCPVDCPSALSAVSSAAKVNGCASPQFTVAQQTAAIICGSEEFARLNAGVCPPSSCQTAANSALTAANAPPSCASVEYATSLAITRASCPGASFASATASIQSKCPTDCTSAIANSRSVATSTGCTSAAFSTAETTAILLCGAQNYSQSVAAGGGLCGIGTKPATDDKPPTNLPPVSEIRPISIAPAPEKPSILLPVPGVEVIVPGRRPGLPPTPSTEVIILPIPPTAEVIGRAPAVEAIPPTGEVLLPTTRPIILPATAVPTAENVTRPRLAPGAEAVTVLPIPTVIVPAGVQPPPMVEAVRPLPAEILPSPTPEVVVLQPATAAPPAKAPTTAPVPVGKVTGVVTPPAKAPAAAPVAVVAVPVGKVASPTVEPRVG